ncbi:MAG: hypothetical protein COA69_13385 [Robiginitomaculum sp.]|nr:MAG: hypothetical protein COA69_13385 [Robiginitomaculum sp.]
MKLTNSYQGFEIPDYKTCDPVPADLLIIEPVKPFATSAKKNRNLLARAQYYGELAAEERSLRLQLIGALKMREASSGRLKALYDKQAEDIRAKIKELQDKEDSRGFWKIFK